MHTPRFVSACRRTAMLLAAAGSLAVSVFGYTAPALAQGVSEARVYPLHNAQANDLQPVLMKMLSGLPDRAEIKVDPRSNQIIITGSEQAQKVARDLIERLDAATPIQAPAPAVRKPTLEVYPRPGGDVQAIAQELVREFGPSGARIEADTRAGQLLVVAPPETQQKIRARLQARDARPAAAPAEAIAPGKPARAAWPAAPRVVSQTFKLAHIAPEQLEKSLSDLWGTRLAALGRTDDLASFALPLAEGDPLELQINRTGEVVLRGPATAVEQGVRLLGVFDAVPSPAGSVARVMPIKYAKPAKIEQTMNALQTDERPVTVAHPTTLAGLFQQPGAQPAQPGNAPPTPAPAPNPAAAPLPPEAAAAADADADTGPIGPVKIEFLEGSDALIITGNKNDVDRVIRLIEEIERISKETEPVIEVLPLEHANSDAVATIVSQLYDQVLSPRQGRVSITSLGKPNALLLIGRAESVKTVVDLVKRIDQPVGPSTQFAVFQLKHAVASAAQATITQFFASRTGLGTKALVTADFRSNALIVQASPRDLLEVQELIKQLDVSTSNAVNELRVFKLQNTMAEDLAPILQGAVQSQADTTTSTSTTPRPPGAAGAQRGGNAPGGAGAGAGATTGSGSQNKSTMLRFLTVDPTGQKRLSSGILTDVRITADPRANSLIVSAPAESLELLAALIDQLDQPPASVSQIKVFTVVNGDAARMVEMLQGLFGQPVTGAGRQGGGGLGGLNFQTNQQGADNGLVPLRFSVDQRTNSIIVSGSPGELNVVEAILLRLDESDVRERKTRVYRLKNAPANDVATAINNLLQGERQVQQLQQDVVSVYQQFEREVIVVPEPVSNSLIVSATSRYYDEIAKIVEQLDARPPMVMIQVLIAEVTLNNVDEFGIELGLQDGLLFDRSLLGNLVTTTNSTTNTTPGGAVTTTQNEIVQSATLTPGYQFNNQPLGNSGSDKSLANEGKVAGQGLSNFSVGRVNNELGFGGLVLSASSESVSVLMRALKETRRLDVLSRPQVVSLDNQPAYVQVGQRVPRITGVQTNEAGQTNSIQLENVGLILGVTPRISPDGLVVMEIDAERSALGPEAEGIPVSIAPNGSVIRSPRIDTTTAQTTVSAMDGQTVVLAGLITKNNSSISRRVPLLSDIPILGQLFRYDSLTAHRTELLIIMTPHVIRTEADADRVRQVEAARLSWCLADVRRMHGDVGLRGRGDEWADSETMTVYPDLAPHGELIAPEGIPVPAGKPTPAKAGDATQSVKPKAEPPVWLPPLPPTVVPQPVLPSPTPALILPAPELPLPNPQGSIPNPQGANSPGESSRSTSDVRFAPTLQQQTYRQQQPLRPSVVNPPQGSPQASAPLPPGNSAPGPQGVAPAVYQSYPSAPASESAVPTGFYAPPPAP